MDTSGGGNRVREYVSLLAATAIGPAFLLIGYRVHGLVFGAAAGAHTLVCVLAVPLLTVLAGRFKFLAWQLSIASITVAVVCDNLRLHAMHRTEIVPVAYVFWASGTLLSSPIPIYLFLKPLTGRRRNIACICIGAIAIALWFGMKSITQ
jgi:hypothetical protein